MGRLNYILIVGFLCLGASLTPEAQTRNKWQDEKFSHRLKSLSEDEYTQAALAGTRINFESLVDPLLIPRVPGTENHVQVRKYLKDSMSNLGWNVDTDAFEDTTPFGKKPFENIIATLNPDVPRRLVLACHFDSKYVREYDFVGATDSAVPCAQMIHLALALKPQLDAHKNSPQNVTLQFIFFDGEEAWQQWTQSDSLYGSRHLAALWERTPYPPNNNKGTNMLHRMDVMVLLDLIGTANPQFNSFFQETQHLHSALVESEQQLKRSRYWSGQRGGNPMFRAQQLYGGIEDDHIPFQQRGVDILHVIAAPFPSVWHTERDNKEALDFPTIDNINRVLRVFVARYLGGYQGDTIPKPVTSTLTSSVSSLLIQPSPVQKILIVASSILHFIG